MEKILHAKNQNIKQPCQPLWILKAQTPIVHVTW